MEFQSNQLDDDEVPDSDMSGEIFYDFHAVVRRYYPYLCFYGALCFIAVLVALTWHQAQIPGELL